MRATAALAWVAAMILSGCPFSPHFIGAQDEPPKPVCEAQGDPCEGPVGDEICDGEGRCFSCTDGAKNGDEDDVDCGGSCSFKCLGAPCVIGDPCKNSVCIDGVCCEDTCNATCKACNVPGHEGTCTDVPQGQEDDTCASAPGNPKACNGYKVCLAGVGAVCTYDEQCFNHTCVYGTCTKSQGEVCADKFECPTTLCLNGICAACSSNFDCPNGLCNSSVCIPGVGEPCIPTLGCVASSCFNGICGKSVGAMCTDNLECYSRFCTLDMATMTTKCTTCSSPADCGGNTCSGGVCLNMLPPSAYCSFDNQCASNMCSGFPKRCQ